MISANSSSHGRRRPRGFSLIELLVAIAILGVTSAIAIPAVSHISSNAEEARAKKQARDIAALFNSGRTAGAFGTVADVASAMDAVGAGGAGLGGLGSSQFVIPGVSSAMNATAPLTHRPSHYLAWQDGGLVYAEGGVVQSAADFFAGLSAAGQAALAQARSNWGSDSPEALAEWRQTMAAWTQAHAPASTSGWSQEDQVGYAGLAAAAASGYPNTYPMGWNGM